MRAPADMEMTTPRIRQYLEWRCAPGDPARAYLSAAAGVYLNSAMISFATAPNGRLPETQIVAPRLPS